MRVNHCRLCFCRTIPGALIVAWTLRLAQHQSMCIRRSTPNIIFSTALLFISISTAAAIGNKYSFSSEEDYLAPAHSLSNWSATLTRNKQQHAALLQCDGSKSGCRGRLRSFNKMLTKSAVLSSVEQISLVNLYINRSRYDEDRVKRIFDHQGNKVGMQRSSWSTLYDFLTKGGDCEDFATSKYFMLRELGFAAQDLRVVVTYERRLHGYHAVLAVRRPNGDVWLLDTDNRIKKKSHRGYRYIFAMNERSVWDHRQDYDGSGSTLE